MTFKQLLVFILWFVTLHSLFVGAAMILLPTNWIAYFDIMPSEHRFYMTQGGIFHLVMAVAYGLAASNVEKNSTIIKFSIAVKFIATFFLLIYFIFVNRFGIVFLSAVGDFCMGSAILLLFRKYKIELCT